MSPSSACADFPQEGKENLVRLVVGDSPIISLLLSFAYTNEFDTKDCPLTYVKLYAAADFYDIEALKWVAAASFEDNLVNDLWESDLFVQAVETIYSETVGYELRNIALDAIVEHATEFLKSETKDVETPFSMLMKSSPEFAEDIAMRLLFEVESLKPKPNNLARRFGEASRCGHCGGWLDDICESRVNFGPF